MNNALHLPQNSEPNPLWWSLPCALLLWVLMVVLFGRLLSMPTAETAAPVPIDAQLVELPVQQAAPPMVKPQPKQLEHHVVKSPPEKIVVPHKMAEPEAPHVERPLDQTNEPPAKAHPQIPPPPTPAPQPSVPNATAHMGAKAIYQPLPQIPDELRDEAISTIAMARFHINTDGSATVELIKPTQNPRINQLILNTLKTWKFFPALQDGKPIPSTQDIKVNVNVS